MYPQCVDTSYVWCGNLYIHMYRLGGKRVDWWICIIYSHHASHHTKLIQLLECYDTDPKDQFSDPAIRQHKFEVMTMLALETPPQ